MAWVLGTNGQEVTCILGNSPGGLELLPTKNYTTNDGSKQWLHVTFKNGKKISLPKGDPYTEIYRIGEHSNMVTNKLDAPFWRLVNPVWLDPVDKKISSRNVDTNRTDPWSKYKICLDKAESFHNELKTMYHKPSYQFYSSGLPTVDKVAFTHEELTFRTYEAVGEWGVPLGIEYSEPSRRASSRGECTMYADTNDQEITSPLPKPKKTYRSLYVQDQ